ncbi:C-terminal processing peptidase [Alteripontixanthobacter maritimus]|uniref:C-terminal processing peptidase n=1 Tax=Alteripontixanthobacter maritimus TaxID=2161824 RepID=A0A369Q887_9SPHN|nr:S41 family peptidase [Alteripontixanthobacter maritimus]RDC60682.1 C-terminal processing peptidase [Alteripontixanthobacter maritimus]
MKIVRTAISLTLATALVACGGNGSISDGGGGSDAPPTSGTPTPAPAPAPTPTAGCSLSERQDFAFQEINQFYLFPDLLDTNANPAAFGTVQGYIDALVAPARAQSKDRFFTYITSIEEEEAFFNSGSSAGFGVRLGYDTAANRVFVLEAYEGAPALAAGIDRGTELLAINGQSVADLMASGGPQAVVNALGASDAGVTRTLQYRNAAGTVTTMNVTKTEFELDPVSNRYGAKIINDGGKKVGYLNLRTFIGPAEDDLLAAFNDFRAQGVTEMIVDFRYNGGGFIFIADLMGDLMGRDKVGQVFSNTVFRPSLASNNSTERFESLPQAIAATKIAFIGRGGTASASELVTNSFIPYLGNNMALVGTNTFGKPVGQIARDKESCDDRLRIVALKTTNANNQGEYFTGLASVVPRTCQADDDIFTQLGEPGEASIARSLDFLAGRACTPIASTRGGTTTARTVQDRRELLQPRQPTAAQREVPGLF